MMARAAAGELRQSHCESSGGELRTLTSGGEGGEG